MVSKNFRKNLLNIPGWRTNRKIVVIESDDWGSIRMPSKEVYISLLKHGLKVDECPYNKFDSLASEDDLTSLFEVLNSFRDINNRPAVITANSLVANPDFDKIKEENFKKYHSEPFTRTLQKYPRHQKSFLLWKDGLDNKVFFPQFHGREHLNVNRWLNYLQKGSKETHLAFEYGLFGISTNITNENRKSFLAALEFDDLNELEEQKNMLSEGLSHFANIFNYHSESFIAPNYIWHPAVESALNDNGVKYIQGASTQFMPEITRNKLIRHHLGQKNKWGQLYLTRNCKFEPSLNREKDWVSSCLKEIEIAFFWNKPAVISSHRLNYIGFIDESNRTMNLKHLENLLKSITQNWPEAEFLTSADLGRIIETK